MDGGLPLGCADGGPLSGLLQPLYSSSSLSPPDRVLSGQNCIQLAGRGVIRQSAEGLMPFLPPPPLRNVTSQQVQCDDLSSVSRHSCFYEDGGRSAGRITQNTKSQSWRNRKEDGVCGFWVKEIFTAWKRWWGGDIWKYWWKFAITVERDGEDCPRTHMTAQSSEKRNQGHCVTF